MDWQIDSSASATAAFAAGIQSSSYVGNQYAGLSGGAIPPPADARKLSPFPTLPELRDDVIDMSRRRAGRQLGVVAVLIAALLLLAAPAAAKQSKRGLFWGAWIGPQLTGTQPPWDMSAVTQFEQRLGKGLSMIQFAAPFADCSVSPCSFYDFPTKEMEAIRQYGAIPFFSWSSQATPGCWVSRSRISSSPT